ncbi:MAG: hypothetical protein K2P13_07540 [Lachnospiraceae bacterium]|jgi:hypothetical protein|nr:hypothetical protein [Lachnospiraceae bacterium]MDE6976828.1 hypothetical protein [Lachnospiraceae bacterium]
MSSGKGAKGSTVKVVIIGIILVCIVIGYYYYLSNKEKKDTDEVQKATAVQAALSYNFEKNYPPTPKEVVKLYGQITQCLHNETYTDEEFEKLALKIQNLYDEELIANKTRNQYLEDLKWDIKNVREQEIVISSYAAGASTDVEYYSMDGYSFAKIPCTFTMRKGTFLEVTDEIFLLRKDADGHWKIYGWTLDEEEEE